MLSDWMNELHAERSAFAELSTASSVRTHLPWLRCSQEGKGAGPPAEI